MTVLNGLFIVVMTGMALSGLVQLATLIRRRGTARDLLDLKLVVAEQRRDLAEAHAALARQGAELAELQERMDFAERLLRQARVPRALPGPNP